MAAAVSSDSLPLAIHAIAAQFVADRNSSRVAWLVWFNTLFQTCALCGFILLASLLNPYAYLACIALIVLLRLVSEGTAGVCLLLRQPALLATFNRKSIFGFGQHAGNSAVIFGDRAHVPEAAVRAILIVLAVMSGTLLFAQAECHSDMMLDQVYVWAHGSSQNLEELVTGCQKELLRWSSRRCTDHPGRRDAVHSWAGTVRLDEEVISLVDCKFHLADCVCQAQLEGWYGAGLLFGSMCFTYVPCTGGDRFKTAAEMLHKLFVPLSCAFLAPPFWFLTSRFLECSRPSGPQMRAKLKEEKANLARLFQMCDGVLRSGWKFRARFCCELAFFLADIVLDIVCFVNLMRTSQGFLFMLQLVVFAVSFVQQLMLGLPGILTAVIDSFKGGYMTAALIRSLQAEKLQESFLSLLIQSAALTNFVRMDGWALTQLNVSMVFSLLGITNALYKEVHLDIAGYKGDRTDTDLVAVYGQPNTE